MIFFNAFEENFTVSQDFTGSSWPPHTCHANKTPINLIVTSLGWNTIPGCASEMLRDLVCALSQAAWFIMLPSEMIQPACNKHSQDNVSAS